MPTEKPDRAEIPVVRDADLPAMVKDYKGDAAVAQGEAFDPSPANIESRTKRIKDRRLDVAFLPKENRGDSVVANISFAARRRKVADEPCAAGQFAVEMLSAVPSKHTRQQIEDEFDRLKAQVNVFGGPTSGRSSHRNDTSESAGSASGSSAKFCASRHFRRTSSIN